MQTRTVVTLTQMRWDGQQEPGVWEINRVNTVEHLRGQGNAAQLMRDVISDADRSKALLWCWIAASGELSKAELRAWYMRLGFTPTFLLSKDEDQLSVIYVRWPSTAVRSIRAPSLAEASVRPRYRAAQSNASERHTPGHPPRSSYSGQGV